MPLVTFFKNFNEPIADKQLDDTLKAIGSGAWKKQIEKLRDYLTTGNQAGFENYKKSLPAFTPSGSFAGGRKLEYLKTYSGFVVLDIDKLSNDKLFKVK
ncbi:MAG TPA: BT4734/BF3469 family protein, partial [Bacteroidales bacterium]